MEIKELKSSGEFEKTVAKGVTLIDFNAPWCGPCRSQEPILEEIADHLSGKGLVSAVNIDENSDIAAKFGVQSIPTLIVFKDSKEMQRFVGVQAKDTLITAMENLIE